MFCSEKGSQSDRAAVPTESVLLFRQDVSVVQTGRAVYSDMVGLKNVACSDRRCRMFRNEEGMFKNRSVIFLDKKCDLFRQEARKDPTGSTECSDRQAVRNVQIKEE